MSRDPRGEARRARLRRLSPGPGTSTSPDRKPPITRTSHGDLAWSPSDDWRSSQGERLAATIRYATGDLSRGSLLPAPDFVVFDTSDNLRAMLECKLVNDGGTARDKALRFERLRAESVRLGGVPLLAVLAAWGGLASTTHTRASRPRHRRPGLHAGHVAVNARGSPVPEPDRSGLAPLGGGLHVNGGPALRRGGEPWLGRDPATAVCLTTRDRHGNRERARRRVASRVSSS